MDTTTLARGLAINRVTFGSGLLLTPHLHGRTWIGRRAARDERTQVMARGLGVRDAALGGGALLALSGRGGGDPRLWFVLQGAADAADLAATVKARHRLPATSVWFACAVAGGSAAIAFAYALGADKPAPASEVPTAPA